MLRKKMNSTNGRGGGRRATMGSGRRKNTSKRVFS
jgi:hypothetical protein